jgi:hypothetical protein
MRDVTHLWRPPDIADEDLEFIVEDGFREQV